MKQDKRLANNVCPSCDHKLNASSDPKGKDDDFLIQAGDVSICLYCCAILQYKDDLSLKEINEVELIALGSTDLYIEVMQVKSSLTKFRNNQN